MESKKDQLSEKENQIGADSSNDMSLIDYGADISREEVLNNPSLQKEILSMFTIRNDQAEDYVSKKRTIFETRLTKYSNPSSFKDAIIKIHTLHQQIKMFIAMFSSTGLQVIFSSQEMGDDETAFRLMKMAEYDRIAMKKDVKDFRGLRNLAFYGCNVRIRTRWNKFQKVIEYTNICPLNRKPDPNGDVINDNFEYHFFDMKMTGYQFLTVNASSENGDVYFNLDKISQGQDTDGGAISSSNNQKEARGLSGPDERRALYDFTEGFMKINARWYAIAVSNGGGNLIKFEPIEAVSKEEKQDPTLIPDPVNVGNIFPIEGDPMGIGYAELVLDKQNAINRLSNMALLKEQREAGFNHFIVDTNVVGNLHSLKKKPINGPVFTPARTKNGEAIKSSPVFAVSEGGASQSTLSLVDRIDQEAQMETNMTDQNRGASVESGLTGGQSQLLQGNSSILFSLDALVLGFYEKAFWKNIRYRSVKEYLPNYEQKIFRLGKGLTGQTFRITRDDVVSGQDPDITIKSKKISEKENQPLIAYLVQKEKTILANPATPQVAKDILSRYIDELSGVDRDMIFLYTPMSPDERRATKYMNMINHNQKPKNMFKPGIDYFTYWIYISQCEESDLKTITLQQIENAIIKSGDSEALAATQQTGGALQGIAASAGSQAMGSFLQQNKSVPTPEGLI